MNQNSEIIKKLNLLDNMTLQKLVKEIIEEHPSRPTYEISIGEEIESYE